MPPTTPVLHIQDLCFGFPQRLLFNHWSACLRSGATLVRGEEGSGKTTLLRLLVGELAWKQGRLIWAGTAGASDALADRRQVFWQDPRSDALHAHSALAWWGTLPARYSAWDAPVLAAHVRGFGLQAHLDKPLYQLSSGSQRKVFMAAALASGAALVLIDEPLAALDAPSVRYLCQALATAAQQARQAGRAWVVAHPEDLPDVPWAHTLVLPDPVGPG